MSRFLRFISVLALALWLGVAVTMTFYVTISVFENESGHVPDSSVAADIVGPLFKRMYVTAWIAMPVAIAAAVGAWALGGDAAVRARRRRPLIIACVLMAVIFFGELYSGAVLRTEMAEIRDKLKAEFGGYHLVEKTNPDRARFGAAHGISISILLADMLLGTAALFLLAAPKIEES